VVVALAAIVVAVVVFGVVDGGEQIVVVVVVDDGGGSVGGGGSVVDVDDVPSPSVGPTGGAGSSAPTDPPGRVAGPTLGSVAFGAVVGRVDERGSDDCVVPPEAVVVDVPAPREPVRCSGGRPDPCEGPLATERLG
jgi:hypothetical protein